MTYRNRYEIGANIDVLAGIPDGTFQCCVTSPPYWGLRDYGHDGQLGLESTPDEYVAKMVEVFRDVRRVLRDDGTLWLNVGDSYAATTKGSGGTKSPKVQIKGADNFQSFDPRSFDLGASGLKPKDIVGIPWRLAFALQADGWWLRSDIIWHKPNPMPESATDRPTSAHEHVFLLAKSARYYYDADAVREPNRTTAGTGEGYLRHHTERPNNGAIGTAGAYRMGSVENGRNRRNVWTIPTKPYSGAHFAVFPPALIKPCIKAGCPKDGIVLDPFFGSGTTGMVAESLGRSWFGIELNPDFAPLIDDRTRQVGLL